MKRVKLDKLIICALIVFFLINLGLIINSYRVRDKFLTAINESTNYITDRYYEQISKEQINNGIILKNDILVQDLNQKQHYVSELVSESPKIIIRYSEQACDLCLESALNILKKYSSTISQDKILILTDFPNIRQLLTFKQTNNISYDVYICESLGLPFENEKRLFMFTINSTLRTRDFFIPEKGLPGLSEKYFKTFFQINH